MSFYDSVCKGTGCLEAERKTTCISCGKKMCRNCAISKICKECLIFFLIDDIHEIQNRTSSIEVYIRKPKRRSEEDESIKNY